MNDYPEDMPIIKLQSMPLYGATALGALDDDMRLVHRADVWTTILEMTEHAELEQIRQEIRRSQRRRERWNRARRRLR